MLNLALPADDIGVQLGEVLQRRFEGASTRRPAGGEVLEALEDLAMAPEPIVRIGVGIDVIEDRAEAIQANEALDGGIVPARPRDQCVELPDTGGIASSATIASKKSRSSSSRPKPTKNT